MDEELTTNEITENAVKSTTHNHEVAEHLRYKMLFWDQDDRTRIHIDKDGQIDMKLD